LHDFTTILALLFAAVLVEPLAKRLDVPLPIAQVICGLLLSALPIFHGLTFAPELVLVLFVPPLLFWTSTTTSMRDVRRNARSILLLAVVLVLVTTVVVAVVAHTVAPALPWASAFVLGAMVAPTDADVTTAIARRLGVPTRLVTVLEGETLLNDTAAFVIYRLAVSAAIVGTFSLVEAATGFVLMAAGGAAVGLAIGWLVARLSRWITDATAASTLSLLTPFAAYLIAEHIGASGVLAVVVAGFCFSRFVPRTVSAGTRVQGRGVWETLIFCVGGLVFTLIGIQLGELAPTLWRGKDPGLLRAAVLVSLTIVGVRLCTVFLGNYLPRLGGKRRSAGEQRPSWRSLAVLSWAGLRGGDTLVMVLGVPLLTASGAPFAGRETLTAIAIGVVGMTLIVMGLTLRPVIRLLAIPHDDSVEDEMRRGRREAARVATERLDVLAEDERLAPEAVMYLRAVIAMRTGIRAGRIDEPAPDEGGTDIHAVREIEREVREAAGAAVVGLRDANVIGQEAMRRLQRDLDLDKIRDAGLDEAQGVVRSARALATSRRAAS
jgi:Na+/H+ antiporter